MYKKLLLALLLITLITTCLAQESSDPESLLDALFQKQETTHPPTLFEMLSINKRPLFVKVETLRFPGNEGTTEYHINYKILNKDLTFIQVGTAFQARLEVTCDIYQDGELVSPNKFEYQPNAPNVAISQSENHYVLDKIEFTLAQEGYSATITINDKNASTFYTQTFELPLLKENALLSDIEISNGVSTELTPALDKFQRGQLQFYVDPIPTISANEKDFVVFYIVHNLKPNENQQYVFTEDITIFKDEAELWKDSNLTTATTLPYRIVKRLPLSDDYNPGLYTLAVQIADLNADNTDTSERTFSLTKKYIVLTERVFPDDEDEFALMSFFLNTRQKRMWKDLSEQGKKGFIDRFWASNNPNPASEDNYFLQTIRMRVSEANWRFSHHRQGWNTDMGRIYIKHGTADDIKKDETPPDARYPRRAYQVWKYHGSDRSYLFLDFQNNGNFRLIHTKNDEGETADPGWRGYFGLNFDESKLDM